MFSAADLLNVASKLSDNNLMILLRRNNQMLINFV